MTPATFLDDVDYEEIEGETILGELGGGGNSINNPVGNQDEDE